MQKQTPNNIQTLHSESVNYTQPMEDRCIHSGVESKISEGICADVYRNFNIRVSETKWMVMLWEKNISIS